MIQIAITPKSVIIPSVLIQITETDASRNIENIEIRRDGQAIFTGSANGSYFEHVDPVDYKREYKYSVYCEAWGNIPVVSIVNYWTTYWTLGEGLYVSADGWLYGAGTATAKAAYKDSLVKSGNMVDFTADIGVGGGFPTYVRKTTDYIYSSSSIKEKGKGPFSLNGYIQTNILPNQKTKMKIAATKVSGTQMTGYKVLVKPTFTGDPGSSLVANFGNGIKLNIKTKTQAVNATVTAEGTPYDAGDYEYDNIIFDFQNTNVAALSSHKLRKAVNTAKIPDMYWVKWVRKGFDNKNIIAWLAQYGQDTFDVKLQLTAGGRQKRLLSGVGAAQKIFTFPAADQLAFDGVLRIRLKHGAKLKIDTSQSSTTYVYQKISTGSLTQNISTSKEPVDGYLLNEHGYGISFHEWSKYGYLDAGAYSVPAASQILEIEGQALPHVYVNDSKKTGAQDITFYASSKVIYNRMREVFSGGAMFYLSVPSSWGRKIRGGRMYCFEGFTIEKIGSVKKEQWLFTVERAREVAASIDLSLLKNWSYKKLLDAVPDYDALMEDQYENYGMVRDNI